ncbi:MAG: transglutaminase domain-containing protein [Phycisphaeraceae bacterium]|nr:transglutaminase domain-containing protein [Phycisphaerales bacterium]MCB9860765.1 transglutaminase domain-containing protein [Phycisphaeraceae bacterium]
MTSHAHRLTSHTASVLSLFVVAIAALGLAVPAHAQRQRPQPTITKDQLGPKDAPQHATPGSTDSGAVPVPSQVQSPFLTQELPKSLTLMVRLGIRQADLVDGKGMPTESDFTFEEATVVFPVLDRTASSSGSDVTKAKAEVSVGDTQFPGNVTVKPNMNSGARFGYWHIPAATGASVSFTLEYPMFCFNTVFDEEAAMKVAWPTGKWPTVCTSTFEPQLYLDYGPVNGKVGPYDTKPIDDNITKWLKGQSPDSMPPVLLAKTLAGAVQGSVQISTQGLNFNKNGEIEGLDLKSPAETLTSRRGSQFEMSALLTAVYRRAGLPARVVVGFDVGEDDDKLFTGKKKENALRAWTEFALWDESTKTLTWVPVDVPRMRKSSSRPRGVDREWPFFGTHDELNRVVPIAHHFHPPAPINTRAYGSPAFYGLWFRPDAPGIAIQHIAFSAISTAQRGSDKTNSR